ncbi:MAG TPA: oligopeptide/dipeptide ABC transporter ATP-binding protein, partial [Pseudodesulfovibrio sp.]|nr:oligopeptide/dipeptide ABC transporter ATP-binding protein [Pseudodesulfovibrio sp.]
IYAGTTVETAPASDFTARGRLRHPYTRLLWNALPQRDFRYVAGNQPMEDRLVQGCIYGERCADRSDECKSHQPLRAVGDGQVRCCHA